MKTKQPLARVLIPLIVMALIHPATLIAGNPKDEITKISVQELRAKMDQQVLVIDVRTGNDYARSKIKIKGAVRIPIVALADQSKTLPKDQEIVLY